jgi:N6-adenosine-specific RNA methylase IME4
VIFQLCCSVTDGKEETALKKELVYLDAIRQAIQKAATVDQAKGIRDKAEALRIYAKQSGQSLEVQNRCAEIKLRAERRAGAILSDMEKNKGARGKGVRFHDESAPTLADLGITQAQSHRWQKIAGIPFRDFETFIAGTKQRGKELTSVSVLRLANELKRPPRPGRKGADIDDRLAHVALPTGELFSTLVIDPPWDELGRRAEALWDLPIPAICAKNAHVYLCVTNKNLEQGFELLRLWGLRYASCLTWCKSSSEEGPYYQSSTEHILFGVRGNLELTRNDVGTWFQWPWGSIHSEKPDRLYELVMSCSPGPYAVLFSRKHRPGWTGLRLDLKTVVSRRHQRVAQPFTLVDLSPGAQVVNCAS